MKYLVSELFDLVEKAKTKQDRITILKLNECEIVKGILALAYDPNLKFNLPSGRPPYKRDIDKPMGYQETTLNLEARRFYIWLTNDQNIKKLKKEALFIEMLEGLHYTEADLLCAVKDKELTTLYSSITEDLVRETFPALLPPAPPKVEEPKETKKAKTKKSKAVSLEA